MKKILFTIALISSVLQIQAQHYAERLSLDDTSSFSMVLLGDPQGYVKYSYTQPIFELCTAWIADNISNLNINAVLCTGDLVEQNENLVPDKDFTDQTSTEMWESVSKAMSRLDGIVPYIISTGNHDYGYKSAENSRTYFPEYFKVTRNPRWKECLVESFPNRNGDMTLENTAYEFSDINWGKILIVATEFAPRDEVLEWIRKLTITEKYHKHKVILMTHSFLEEKSAKRTSNEKYRLSPHNYGEDIWEKLVDASENIRLVICGHAGTPGGYENSVAYRKDTNSKGVEVHQMMFNVQTLGGGWKGNGGDGWLRLLEFHPDGKTISVNTYSPLFGISSATRHLAHREASYDKFDMIVN